MDKRTKITPTFLTRPIRGAHKHLKTSTINGTVFSGKGEGKKYIELSWVKNQIQEKLGFTPYIGTLNIRLPDSNISTLKRTLKTAKPIKIAPQNGFCSGKSYKAVVDDLSCALIIPEVKGYPDNIIELIAPVNIRKHLQLRDGDEINIQILH